MIRNTFLGLGPMSLEIINSLDYFSKKHKKKIMLICSRNQIESSQLGGGYVNNFSTKKFADLIKTNEETIFPGNATCCLPEDIHSVWNNGEDIALSIHTYGMHLNHTGRSIFDVESKTETPCIVQVQN